MIINKFRIEIDAAVPLNRIKRDPNPTKMLIFAYLLEYAESKKWFHIKNALLSRIKHKGKRKILVGDYFYYRRIHGNLLSI